MPLARALLAPLALLLSAALVDASAPPPLAPGAVHVNSTDALVQNVGDTSVQRIVMAAGHYLLSSTISVSRALTIEAEGGGGEVRIDGQRQTQLFSVRFSVSGSANLTLIGLTLVNGHSSGYNNGGGAAFVDSGALRLSGCILASNSAVRARTSHVLSGLIPSS